MSINKSISKAVFGVMIFSAFIFALYAPFISFAVGNGFNNDLGSFAPKSAFACGTCSCNTCNQPQPLLGTCYPDSNSVTVGQAVLFTALASGGSGNYTYSWSGGNGASGSGSTLSQTYQNPGTYNLSVAISDGSQHISRPCYVVVNGTPVQPPQNFYVSCYANPSSAQVGQVINWYANATGGNGNFTYSWSGTNLSGSGQSTSASYSSPGTYNGSVTVTSSGGQSEVANCSTYIQQTYTPPIYYPPVYPPIYNNQPLSVSCYGTPSNPSTNTQVEWYGNVSGGSNGSYYGSGNGYLNGSGNYTYYWTGTDGLYGNTSNAYNTYANPGVKNATLTVYSNGQSAVANCSVSVGGVGQLSSGVYLTQVPYTGVDFNLKLVLFLIGITLWSAFAAYMIIRKRNSMAYSNGVKTDMSDRLEEFKKQNLKNRN